MKRISTRMMVHARDIENLTGRKRSWVNNLMKKIRTLHNKTSEDMITLSEFCSYMKVNEEDVIQRLLD